MLFSGRRRYLIFLEREVESSRHQIYFGEAALALPCIVGNFCMLVAYDPRWPQMFLAMQEQLFSVVGASITAIHHIGSTSVPGLCAKPIIDICIESELYPPNEMVIAALVQLGFTHHGEAGVLGRHWFATGNPRTHHLHWCPVKGAIVQAALKFRDALRANPALRNAYANGKVASVQKNQVDGLAYNQDKEPFILQVLMRED